MAGVLAACLVVVLLFKSILTSFNNPVQDQFAVPSVIGMPVEEAETLPEVNGIFTIDVQEETVYSDKYKAGEIVKQDPKEGEFRKGDNTVIQVWVSAGEDIGTMIDVTNMTYAAAKVELKSLIEQYDLELVEPTEEEYVYSDKVTENYIISTDPAAEEPLKKGDTIHFVISKGPEIKQVPVPQFVGKQIDQVLEEVKELNLTCNAEDIETVSSDEPGGTVIWQSIPVNTMAEEWDTIKFQVSAGLAETTITQFYELPGAPGRCHHRSRARYTWEMRMSRSTTRR